MIPPDLPPFGRLASPAARWEFLAQGWARSLPRFHATLIMRASLSDPLPALDEGESAYAVCSPQEARLHLAKLPADEREPALLRLAQADRFVYLAREGELCFWEFVQLDRSEIPPDALAKAEAGRLAYIFGAYTRVACRGQGLFTGGLRWLMRWLQAAGYHQLYSQPAADDLVSVLAHLSAGFQVLGEGHHVHWRGRRRMRRTRLLAAPLGPQCQDEAQFACLSARARDCLRRAFGCGRR